MSTPFLLSLDEVEQRTCLCGLTLMRQEKLGRFPKRVKISSRRIAYLGAEIEDWLRDPEAWRQRDSAKITASALSKAAVTQADTVRPEGFAG